MQYGGATEHSNVTAGVLTYSGVAVAKLEFALKSAETSVTVESLLGMTPKLLRIKKARRVVFAVAFWGLSPEVSQVLSK